MAKPEYKPEHKASEPKAPVPPVISNPPARPGGPFWAPIDDTEEARAKRHREQQLPVVVPTAEESQQVWDNQAEAIKQARLKALAYQYPEVRELMEKAEKAGKKV